MRVAFEVLPDGNRVPVHILTGKNPMMDQVAARRLKVMDTEDCDHSATCQGCAAVHWIAEAVLVRLTSIEASVSRLEDA